MRTIVADPLVLEPQTEAHAESMFEVLSDPALYAHEGEPPQSIERLRERFRRLESRRSADGSEEWLNWVVRASPTTPPIGYVQSTVRADGRAAIAYVFASRHWGRGWATRAVEAMLAELAERHGAHVATAVLKTANAPSMRLLLRLGFTVASRELNVALAIDPDESAMCRVLRAASE